MRDCETTTTAKTAIAEPTPAEREISVSGIRYRHRNTQRKRTLMDGQITEIHPEKEKAERENKRVLSSFVKVSIASGIVIVIAFVFFVWNTVDWFKWDRSVNSDLLGTFGDFIGGILGTIIAIYSIYMLVLVLVKA